MSTDTVWVRLPGANYEVCAQGYVRNATTLHVLTPMRMGSRRKSAQRSKVSLHGRVYDVAHLILETFVGPRPPGALAMHKDDDTRNNALANLRWGTHQDNARDSSSKMRCARQKLSWSACREIAARRANGERGADLAREYGVSQQTICDVYNGRRAGVTQ